MGCVPQPETLAFNSPLSLRRAWKKGIPKDTSLVGRALRMYSGVKVLKRQRMDVVGLRERRERRGGVSWWAWRAIIRRS